MTLLTPPRGRALSGCESNTTTFNPNSLSSSSGFNSFVPNSREYWSSVASIVSNSISRTSHSSPSPDPAPFPELDPNSSASFFLRGCVGASPPFTFRESSVLSIHAANALGDMSLDRYRRLRLCRATGDLPYTAAIPAGLSCDEGAAQAHSVSGPISGGHFRGGISAVIWNSQALFCFRDDRHMEKSNYVHYLAARYDIILLSEVHGLRGAPELWRPGLPMGLMLIGPWELRLVLREWAF